MKIEKLVVGELQTNCFLVWCSKTQEGIVIDPGDGPNFIAQQVQDLDILPKLIVATHGHFDHITAVNALKIRYQAPFLLHKNDNFLVERMNRTARHWLGKNLDFGPPPSVDQFIKEGDWIEFGHQKLKVIETPGHSPGGVSLFGEENTSIILFSGDTLFKQGVGRTDFSYASEAEQNQSLEKLFKFPEETIVYPGHGPETTIGEEKKILGYLKAQEFL